MSEPSKRVRYNLNLAIDLYAELQRIAAREDTTILELMRRAIKLYLIAVKIAETPGATLIVREGDQEREIVLLRLKREGTE